MAIIFSPTNTTLAEVDTGETFTVTLSASSNTIGANIVSFSVNANPTDSNVTITTTANSANISGAYTLSVFPEYTVKYVKNDTIQTTIVDGFPSGLGLCETNNIYTMEPDPNISIDVEYKVSAEDSLGNTANTTYTQTVVQIYDQARDYVKNCVVANKD